MTKRILMTLLAVLFLGMLGTCSFADASHLDDAEKLSSLGMLAGTDNGFELERELPRIEGSIMLVRLLGKENDAVSNHYSHPFTDVPKWANDYVGYLYYNGLTSGIGATTFGSNDLMTSSQYTTFILRALGYKDSEGDFKWNESLDKAAEIHLITDQEKMALEGNAKFLRDDMVGISYSALSTCIKDSEGTLADKLISENVFNQELAEEAGLKESNRIKFISEQSLLPTQVSWGMNVEEVLEICGSEDVTITAKEDGETEIVYLLANGKAIFRIMDDQGLAQYVTEEYRYNVGDYAIVEEFDLKNNSIWDNVYDESKHDGYSSNWGKFAMDAYERDMRSITGYGYQMVYVKNSNTYTIMDLYGQVDDQILNECFRTQQYSDQLDQMKIVIRTTSGTGDFPEHFTEGAFFGWYWMLPEITDEQIEIYESMVNIKAAMYPAEYCKSEDQEVPDIGMGIDVSRLPEEIQDFDRFVVYGSHEDFDKELIMYQFESLLYYSNPFKSEILSECNLDDFVGLVMLFRDDVPVGMYLNKYED